MNQHNLLIYYLLQSYTFLLIDFFLSPLHMLTTPTLALLTHSPLSPKHSSPPPLCSCSPSQTLPGQLHVREQPGYCLGRGGVRVLQGGMLGMGGGSYMDSGQGSKMACIGW